MSKRAHGYAPLRRMNRWNEEALRPFDYAQDRRAQGERWDGGQAPARRHLLLCGVPGAEAPVQILFAVCLGTRVACGSRIRAAPGGEGN